MYEDILFDTEICIPTEYVYKCTAFGTCQI